MSESIDIPNKSHFRIDEVVNLTGVRSYVLRFWESEFDDISPIVSSSGQKLYERKDIETIITIKRLLFEEKLSIERARAKLRTDLFQETQDLLGPTVAQTDGTSMETSRPAPAAVDMNNLQSVKDKLNLIVDWSTEVKNKYNWA